MTTELWQLRNSERKSYKRCRWRWDLNYNRGIQKKKHGTPLRFGSMVHDALEVWYKPGIERGTHPTETFKRLYAESLKTNPKSGSWSEEGDWDEIGELGEAMLDHYVEYYGTDPLIEVISPEQPFQIDIHDPITGEYVVTAVGTIDVIIRDLKTGKIGLLEHKTYKSIKTDFLAIDEQASTYWALAGPWMVQQGILEEGEHIDFMLYNILRKAKPDPRDKNEKGQYLNKNGSVSKRQPPPFFKRYPVYRDPSDRQIFINRLIMEAREIKRAREGDLDIFKNPTHMCPYDCDFFDVCEIHDAGGDHEELLELTTMPYDPYDAHHPDEKEFEDR